MLRHRGIEANTDKCEAFLTMRSLCNLKEVQHLNGKLATLSKFLPRLMKKAKPFLILLKGIMKFHYNENYENIFQEIKRDITSLSILVSPHPCATLTLHLVVPNQLSTCSRRRSTTIFDLLYKSNVRTCQGAIPNHWKISTCSIFTLWKAYQIMQVVTSKTRYHFPRDSCNTK